MSKPKTEEQRALASVAAIVSLVKEMVDDPAGIITLDRRDSTCAFIVKNRPVLFDAALDSDEYRIAIVEEVGETLADYMACISDEMAGDAAQTFTAYAMLPMTERHGLFQVARMTVVDGQIVSVKRYDKHQPEMLHFALHKLFEAVRADVELQFDPPKHNDETLENVVDEKPKQATRARETVRVL